MAHPKEDSKRELLRHTLATAAYRGGKAIRNAPASFASFDGAGKTPAEILAHLGDLFDWALSMANGKPAWKNSSPLAWEQESARFFASLQAFDSYLASGEPLHAPAEKLFQGPIADALTHIGQIAMMRRLAGSKISGENYYVAEIQMGRVGDEQARPAREF
jgi:hypothetical protein